jgi:FixJ family two-component response regulator
LVRAERRWRCASPWPKEKFSPVLDVTLPDLNGLDLQKRVAVDRIDMPIIFITGPIFGIAILEKGL